MRDVVFGKRINDEVPLPIKNSPRGNSDGVDSLVGGGRTHAKIRFNENLGVVVVDARLVVCSAVATFVSSLGNEKWNAFCVRSLRKFCRCQFTIKVAWW
jgi:hypothetical protein